jgi:hypothetical protein
MVEARRADGWERHRMDEIDRWLATTPAQRVEWLEDMLDLAVRIGALPRTHDRPPGSPTRQPSEGHSKPSQGS